MKTTNKKSSKLEINLNTFELVAVLFVATMYVILDQENISGEFMYPYILIAYIAFIATRILLGILFKFQSVINDSDFLAVALVFGYFATVDNQTYLMVLSAFIMSILFIKIVYIEIIQWNEEVE
jgi:hypothetical protein